VIVVLAVLGGMVVIGVPFAIGVGLGVWNVVKTRTPAEDPRTVPLTQSYATPNGLLTAHYPADFAAKALDHATLAMTRKVGAVDTESVVVAAVAHPVTNDVREFARLLDAQSETFVRSNGGTYTKTGEHAATCLGGRPGWSVEIRYTMAIGSAYVSKTCYAIENDIGYEFRYDLPQPQVSRDTVLVERIIEATDVAPPAPPEDPMKVALSESYVTKNGLLTAHYPADFAASTPDAGTIVLTRNLDASEADVITLGAVRSPVTNDVHEFARILHAATEKNVLAQGGSSYAWEDQRPASCLGKYPGLEVEVSYRLPPAGVFVSYSCFFLMKGRGYELRYDVPQGRASTDAVLARRVLDATEIAP